MKITFVLDTPYAWKSGIWYHRNHVPSIGLKRRGHDVRFISLGGTIADELLEWPDVVIFGRTYHPDSKPLEALRQYKALGKRVLWDIDDDFWTVNPDNPSVAVSNAYKDQYEAFVRECDAVITPSKVIAKKVRKLVKNKEVHICPNGINFEFYKERPRTHENLIIGYAGAASHWKDLEIIVEPLIKLSKEHDFIFVVYGLVGGPLEGEMYVYDQIVKRGLQPEREEYYRSALNWFSRAKELKFLHIPFHPPELHPVILSKCDFDIGLAPLQDNEFNRAKSCIKFYEYASVGTVTLASKVLPYKEEVNYCAKNTTKDLSLIHI